MEDDEKTYAQLQQRVQKTIDVLKTAKAANFEGKEGVEVVIKLPNRELKFTGITYLQTFGKWCLCLVVLPWRMAFAGVSWDRFC